MAVHVRHHFWVCYIKLLKEAGYVVPVFRIVFKGVKLDLSLTEQGDSKSECKEPGVAYTHFILHLSTRHWVNTDAEG